MKTTIPRRLISIISAAAILSGSVQLAHAQAPDMEDFLPVEHTMTDTTGRKIAATILSKTDTTIKFRRTSDGKEFEYSHRKTVPSRSGVPQDAGEIRTD